VLLRLISSKDMPNSLSKGWATRFDTSKMSKADTSCFLFFRKV
jgi:hypothetical protein